ncbi:MAG TPA: cytochrome b N-terminal domain-containing protein [Acidimicrobiales bacterium]|nr:cytochrome b N-terminal domain-containing protein [Acidimicrobiales bacterium]
MSSVAERSANRKRAKRESQVLDFVDDRLGSSKWIRSALDKIFPDHWSFMVGEVAMYCFVLLIVTGIYLALFYSPSSQVVVYHGSYAPLDGQHFTQAYESVINLSFNVRFGLLMRQAHHWAANIFMAALVFHMCRVFFTGAFRRPREVNWIIGVTLLTIVMLEGFSGYSLPDDLLSGSGLRVVFSIVQSIPFVGPWLAFDVWGGAFPGSTDFLERLFVIHEFVFPLILAGLLGAHLAILWHQKHTDFPGPGKTEKNIVGSRLWPQYAIKSQALLMFVAMVVFGLGGLVQINPIWIYGPFEAARSSAGTQPDWYVGWLDGALRLWPHWEFRSFGHEIANPFFPGILLPGIVFGVIYAWPWIDKRLYADYGEHNLLDRPRDKPLRTAIGVGALCFFADLTIASATDLIGNALSMSFELLIEILQYASFVAPIVGGLIAYRACILLQRTGTHPIQRPVGGIIVRDETGAYHTLGASHGHGEEANGHGNAEEALLERVGAIARPETEAELAVRAGPGHVVEPPTSGPPTSGPPTSGPPTSEPAASGRWVGGKEGAPDGQGPDGGQHPEG